LAKKSLNTENNKRTNASITREGKKKKKTSITDEDYDYGASSAGETDNDLEMGEEEPDLLSDDAEEPDLLSDDAELVDAEGKDVSHFNPDLYVFCDIFEFSFNNNVWIPTLT
jgi:hypothetical protein